jgi:hypothetical protein
VDIVFGPDGALYYVAFRAGEVRRAASSGGGVPSGGEQPLAGSKLTLAGGVKKTFKVLAKDSIVLGGSLDDPTAAGGSLRIFGDGFDDTYPLPASGWIAIGKPGAVMGYKYQDKLLENGPINGVQITGGKLFKAAGKGPGLLHELGESAPDAVGIVLELGTRRYCLSFGGEAKYNPQKLQLAAKNAPAPTECP